MANYRTTADWEAERSTYRNTVSKGVIEANVGAKDTQPLYSGSAHMMGSWIYEPHRQNHFELQICGLEDMDVMDKTSRGTVFTSNYTSTYLTLSLNNFTMPDLTVGKIQMSYGNSKINYAATPENNEISITFNDYVGLSTETILCAWFRQVYDPITEKLNYSSKYKKDAFVMEYNVDGGFGGCWKIEGLWIRSLKLGSYSQENGQQVRKLECQFCYDRMYPHQLLSNNMVKKTKNAEGKTTYTTLI